MKIGNFRAVQTAESPVPHSRKTGGALRVATIDKGPGMIDVFVTHHLPIVDLVI